MALDDYRIPSGSLIDFGLINHGGSSDDMAMAGIPTFIHVATQSIRRRFPQIRCAK